MLEEKTIKWTAIIWGAILIFIISTLLTAVVPTVYGTYIGFQTRGDMELVNEGVARVTGSVFFALYVYLSLALVALWRGFILAQKVTARLGLHIGLAAGLAFLLPLLVGFILGQDIAALPELLFYALALFGGAYLGAYLASRRAEIKPELG